MIKAFVFKDFVTVIGKEGPVNGDSLRPPSRISIEHPLMVIRQQHGITLLPFPMLCEVFVSQLANHSVELNSNDLLTTYTVDEPNAIDAYEKQVAEIYFGVVTPSIIKPS